MLDFFTIIKDYLTQKQENALDVIFLAVAVGIIMAILTKLYKSIINFINRMRFTFSKMYRKYIKQQMDLNEYIDLQKRLENGEKLRWYERKGYSEYKLEEQLQKKRKTVIGSFDIHKEALVLHKYCRNFQSYYPPCLEPKR